MNRAARIWRRELAQGIDHEVTVQEGSPVERARKEVWNLICRVSPADMSEELAQQLWPDLAPGRYRSDGWYVERLRLRNIATSDHCQAEVDLVAKAKADRDDPDPTRRPVSWEMDTDYIEKPAETDGDGNLLVNTAGDPIIGIVDYEPILVWTATRYVTRTPPWLKQFAQKCVNASPVSIDGFECAPETLKMEGLRLGPVEVTTVNGREILYREMPLKLLYKDSTWKDEYLNQGYTEYFPPQGQIFATNLFSVPARRVPCVDSTGKPVESPVPLNKEGQRIREKVRRTVTESGISRTFEEWVIKERLDKKDLHFLKVQRYRKLDFNLLLS